MRKNISTSGKTLKGEPTIVFRITEEEREAINRLCETFGTPEHKGGE